MNIIELKIHLEVLDNKLRQVFDAFLKEFCPPESRTDFISLLEQLYSDTDDVRTEEVIELLQDYISNRIKDGTLKP